MNINGREIGYDQPPYVIAEMSCNHGGKLANAYAIINAAKDAGADAIKIQTYTPDSLTIDAPLFVDGGEWHGKRLYDLYKKTHTPFEWHKSLFAYAAALEMTMFSSVYCLDGLALLESLDCPAYKIASFELCHHRLLTAVAKTRKPVIASCGAADDGEILEAVRILSHNGCSQLALLHCVSDYPADHAGLSRINTLKQWVNGRALIGFSDHTAQGVETLAVAAGACILERHLRLPMVDTEDGSFSDVPTVFEAYCHNAGAAHELMKPQGTTKEVKRFKRSIYCTKDVAEGESFSKDNVAVIRPGYGLHPRMLDAVLDTVATTAIKRGEPITRDNADLFA